MTTPNSQNPLFDPTSRYNRFRRGVDLGGKMREYFRWLRANPEGAVTTLRDSAVWTDRPTLELAVAAAPASRFVVRLDQPDRKIFAEIHVRIRPRDGGNLIDVLLQLSDSDRPKQKVSCRAFLIEPLIWNDLAAALESEGEESDNSLAVAAAAGRDREVAAKLFDPERVEQNFEIARIVSALPELQGHINPENGRGEFEPISLPKECAAVVEVPDRVFVIVVIDRYPEG